MNLDNIEKLYTNNISKYGIDSRAVGWNSQESQNMRFKKLLEVVEDKSVSSSINELGCGYGELFKYLENNEFEFEQFNGYDISQPMLDSCKKYLNSPQKVYLYHHSSLKTKADYSLTSGIFNTPFQNDREIWEKYIENTLKNMYEYSNKGISFNFLTTYVDFKSDNLFYKNPSDILDFCLKNFGKKVVIYHDYNLFEYTVIVKK